MNKRQPKLNSKIDNAINKYYKWISNSKLILKNKNLSKEKIDEINNEIKIAMNPAIDQTQLEECKKIALEIFSQPCKEIKHQTIS